MKFAGRDWIFIAVIVALLGVLFLGTGKEKAKDIPYDAKHSRFHDIMRTGGERKELEKECATCHTGKDMPLPRAHPPKEQCLICHKFNPANR